jgi:hypothetical protein
MEKDAIRAARGDESGIDAAQKVTALIGDSVLLGVSSAAFKTQKNNE